MRQRLLGFAVLAVAAAIAAALLWRAGAENAGANSYALLADAFLHGRYDFRGCYDQHCVASGGLNYLAAPPFPAVFAMPFALRSGAGFAGFVALAIGLAAAALLVWHQIFRRIGVDASTRLSLMAALGAATPLAEAVGHADRLAAFAAVAAFLMASIAIHEAIAGRLMTAGFTLGLAFLCRPAAMMLAPLVFALTLTLNATVLPPSREAATKFAAIAIAAALPIAFLLFYDWARFGSPLLSGESVAAAHASMTSGDVLAAKRTAAYGAYSTAFLPSNLAAMLFQGPRLLFDPPLSTKPVGLDPAGASFLAASPFLIFLFFAARDRTMAFAALAVLPLLAVRALSADLGRFGMGLPLIDLMPVALLYLGVALKPEHGPAFRLLVLWGAAIELIGLLSTGAGP